MKETFALVERARSDGYSTLSEQMERDVGAIALPIHDHSGSVQGCVLISGPLTRWNPSKSVPQLPAIEAIVAAVSRRLGWRGDGANPSR
jgi:DNA-binding IclR family transcriptional regulator